MLASRRRPRWGFNGAAGSALGTSGTVQGCSMVPRSGSRAGVLPRAVPRLAFPRLSMAMCSAWSRWRQRPCATEQAAARRGGRASTERMGCHVVGGVGNTRQARRRVHPSGAVGPIGLKASGPPPFRLWLQGGVFAMSWHRVGQTTPTGACGASHGIRPRAFPTAHRRVWAARRVWSTGIRPCGLRCLARRVSTRLRVCGWRQRPCRALTGRGRSPPTLAARHPASQPSRRAPVSVPAPRGSIRAPASPRHVLTVRASPSRLAAGASPHAFGPVGWLPSSALLREDGATPSPRTWRGRDTGYYRA